jgi:hypothetical protein
MPQPRAAWDFKQAWPEIELHFVPDAGHSAKEPGTVKLLTEVSWTERERRTPCLTSFQACDRFASL